jgi:hypothetical protein
MAGSPAGQAATRYPPAGMAAQHFVPLVTGQNQGVFMGRDTLRKNGKPFTKTERNRRSLANGKTALKAQPIPVAARQRLVIYRPIRRPAAGRSRSPGGRRRSGEGECVSKRDGFYANSMRTSGVGDQIILAYFRRGWPLLREVLAGAAF